MELDEKQLVKRAQAGDKQAFGALVRTYQRRIFRLAMGMVRNEDDALDIAQETFVKAHRNLDRFKGDAAFYTWLYRIAKNLCIDHLRKRRGEQVEYDDGVGRDDAAQGDTLGLDAPSKRDGPSKRLMNSELGAQLHAALQTLSEDHREILLLREVEGLSYEELAETLEIKKGTVMSRLFHARKKMQAALAGYVEGAPDGAEDGASTQKRERA